MGCGERRIIGGGRTYAGAPAEEGTEQPDAELIQTRDLREETGKYRRPEAEGQREHRGEPVPQAVRRGPATTPHRLRRRWSAPRERRADAARRSRHANED